MAAYHEKNQQKTTRILSRKTQGDFEIKDLKKNSISVHAKETGYLKNKNNNKKPHNKVVTTNPVWPQMFPP